MAKKQKTGKNLLEVQNAAKTLFANIRFHSVDNPIHTLLLTSSVPDEGKTTTAWYLAQAMATAGNSVLLVEGDMRRRSLANMLQLHPERGLYSVLSNATPLQQAVVSTSVPNLYFLDAEPSIPNPADLLASNSMRALNDRMSKAFNYVIYDMPPVGTFVDAAVLGTVVDACILVTRAGRAKRSELQLAYEQLTNAGANVIGLCATFVEGTGSEYYYSYYTKDTRLSEEKVAASQTPAAMRSGVGGDADSRDAVNEDDGDDADADTDVIVSIKEVQPDFAAAESNSGAKRANSRSEYSAISVPRSTRRGAAGSGNAKDSQQRPAGRHVR